MFQHARIVWGFGVVMSESTVWERWTQCSGAMWDLYKRGIEGIVFRPLSARAEAVAELATRSLPLGNYELRKLSYALVGYADDVDPKLLVRCLRSERARRGEVEGDPLQTAFLQSAVEDVVLSAARWCEGDSNRAAGLSLLADFVEIVLAGEYWNTISYAMATLVFHRHPGYEDLLERFAHFAKTSPSAGYQERDFAIHLAAGDKTAVQSIHRLMLDKDALAAAAVLPADWSEQLDRLLRAAGVPKTDRLKS